MQCGILSTIPIPIPIVGLCPLGFWPVGFCPVGFCPVGFCPVGLCPDTGTVVEIRTV